MNMHMINYQPWTSYVDPKVNFLIYASQSSSFHSAEIGSGVTLHVFLDILCTYECIDGCTQAYDICYCILISLHYFMLQKGIPMWSLFLLSSKCRFYIYCLSKSNCGEFVALNSTVPLTGKDGWKPFQEVDVVVGVVAVHFMSD